MEMSEISDKTLAELSELFGELKKSADAMTRSKEAEAIKSAFYKLLVKLKSETPAAEISEEPGPFEQVEENFKALYADYKKERAEFNRQQDAQREENLKVKKQIVEDLKDLIESQEDVSDTFPKFREIQQRWRDAGPVPVTDFREINDNYQFQVEKFYDMVKINHDLRDLDFKKNLEAKQAFCEAAEKLAENENIVNAFNELQKLHEQWKEFGPVAKEFRDDIWNRFKAATAVINKRYQAHFEEMKQRQAENLDAKTGLCERLETLVSGALEQVRNSGEWNAMTKEIEEIQTEWRKIGFATKKENQKIYDRFRASCDKFFEAKKEFYARSREEMNANMEKKLSIIELAEQLKDSTEWKKTTDQFISLQKQWKEAGAVPYKKSEQLWKRFRAACDEFFERRDAQMKQERPTRNQGPARNNAKDSLVQKYRTLQQDITTYENNIGFFSSSKNSEALVKQMQERIDAAKAELKKLEEQINNG